LSNGGQTKSVIGELRALVQPVTALATSPRHSVDQLNLGDPAFLHIDGGTE
jgi:hypothetical protein